MNNITIVDPSHFVLCSFRYRACFSYWIIIVRLNEVLLAKVHDQVQNNKSLSWYLMEIPDYGFYQDLHEMASHLRLQ